MGILCVLLCETVNYMERFNIQSAVQNIARDGESERGRDGGAERWSRRPNACAHECAIFHGRLLRDSFIRGAFAARVVVLNAERMRGRFGTYLLTCCLISERSLGEFINKM